MGSILNAADANPDKFIIGEIPVKSGDVSIMTLEHLYEALGDSKYFTGFEYDPSYGYDSSTYYVYAINDTCGINDAFDKSTLTNLRAVGADWYKKLNKPTTRDNHWTLDNHKIFGGPLTNVYRDYDDTYDFFWYYMDNSYDCSSSIRYWNRYASKDVCVVVVRAR